MSEQRKRLTKADTQPDPKVWPACDECSEPYALRRRFAMRTTTNAQGKRVNGFEGVWVWTQDCAHKKAGAHPAAADGFEHFLGATGMAHER